jgi:SNW domain-containing protein 1
MFDTRLYNQSQGMSQGFGNDDDYSVYSKPFSAGSAQTSLYKPTKVLTQHGLVFFCSALI